MEHMEKNRIDDQMEVFTGQLGNFKIIDHFEQSNNIIKKNHEIICVYTRCIPKLWSSDSYLTLTLLQANI